MINLKSHVQSPHCLLPEILLHSREKPTLGTETGNRTDSGNLRKEENFHWEHGQVN